LSQENVPETHRTAVDFSTNEHLKVICYGKTVQIDTDCIRNCIA